MQFEQGCNVVNLGIDADIDLGIPVPPPQNAWVVGCINWRLCRNVLRMPKARHRRLSLGAEAKRKDWADLPWEQTC